MQTLALKAIQIVGQWAGLLESYANVLGMPAPARRLKRLDELPPDLRRHVGVGPGQQYAWLAWISGEQTTLLTRAPAFARSREEAVRYSRSDATRATACFRTAPLGSARA